MTDDAAVPSKLTIEPLVNCVPVMDTLLPLTADDGKKELMVGGRYVKFVVLVAMPAGLVTLLHHLHPKPHTP